MSKHNQTNINYQNHNREVIAYYDGRIKKTMTPRDSNYLNHHVDRFLEYTGIKPGERVLEIGCGMGRYTLPLAGKGIDIEGMDISRFLLNQLVAFNNSQYEIPLYCADVIDYPKDLNGKFNAVIGFFTLHHVHDLVRCFAAMRELVKPGGLVAFLEPNAYNVLYYLQIILTPTMTWQGDGGMALMRPGVIFPAMEKGGFIDLGLDRCGFFPPFLTNTKLGYQMELDLERIRLWRGLLPAAIFSGRRPD